MGVAHWQAFPALAPAPLRWWLLQRDSLTELLRARCSEFVVRPVRQALAPVRQDERMALRLRCPARAWVREVELLCDGVPVVFAHSALASEHLRGVWRGVRGLGQRSLGSMLFSDARVQRQPFGFRCLNNGHSLYERARSAWPTQVPGKQAPRTLWARRSLFVLQGQALAVTEVFLPTVLNLKTLKSR